MEGRVAEDPGDVLVIRPGRDHRPGLVELGRRGPGVFAIDNYVPAGSPDPAAAGLEVGHEGTSDVADLDYELGGRPLDLVIVGLNVERKGLIQVSFPGHVLEAPGDPDDGVVGEGNLE